VLERVYETLRGLPRAMEGFADVRSVVVFGSAARPEDFVEGVSDVDVLVLAAGEPRERHCTLELGEGLRVEAVVLKPEELVKLAEEGDPLAFMVERGVVVADDGTFASLRLEPRVTERTVSVLRRSAVVALGLALENLLRGEPLRAVHHAYHAVRHAVRYRTALERGCVPISDREVSEAGGDAAEAFNALASARRGKRVDRLGAELALQLAAETVAALLGLKAPKLIELASSKGGRWPLGLARKAGSSSSWCCALRGRARGFTSSPRAGSPRSRLSAPLVSRASMRGSSL
jgi:predicted nucleotidyltransferase